MRVRIHMGLDLDGIHDLRWEASDAHTAVEVPRSTLDRWTAEREAFRVAYLRWKRVSEEVEETLYQIERERRQAPVSLATAVAESRARHHR